HHHLHGLLLRFQQLPGAQHRRGARGALSRTEGTRAGRLSAPIRHYLRAPSLTVGGAAAFLRASYVLAFMGQVAAAVLVGELVLLLAGGVTRSPSSLLAWVLVGLALLQLPVITFATARLGAVRSGSGARRAALHGALVTGVLLASSAWFLSLALATVQSGPPLFLLLALTLFAYGLGFLLTGRLGRVAASEAFEEP